jgi:hypothetical protein
VRGQAEAEHLVACEQPILTGGELHARLIDSGLHLTSRADTALLICGARHIANFSSDSAPGAAAVEKI